MAEHKRRRRRRHWSRRSSLSRFALRFTVVALIGIPFLCLWRPRPDHHSLHSGVLITGDGTGQGLPIQYTPLLTVSNSNDPRHIIYPYSVIPGGVRDTRELKEAISNDPVVADHYSGFDVSKSRPVQLNTERLAYVSYRLRNEVFWTQTKRRIPAGERLITDGRNYARTRCGNRISEVAHAKTSPHEPTPEELETPLNLPNQGVTEIPAKLPAEVVEAVPPAAENPSAPAAISEVAPPGGFFPVPPVVFPAVSPPSSHKHQACPPPDPPSPPCHKRPPPAPIPEPGTLLLVSTGLGYVAYRKKLKGRGRRPPLPQP